MKKLLRMKQVCERTGVSRAGIYRLLETDDFPRPVRITERSIGFPEEEIEEWITQRMETHRVERATDDIQWGDAA